MDENTTSRRDFLKTLGFGGAALATGSLTGCFRKRGGDDPTPKNRTLSDAEKQAINDSVSFGTWAEYYGWDSSNSEALKQYDQVAVNPAYFGAGSLGGKEVARLYPFAVYNITPAGSDSFEEGLVHQLDAMQDAYLKDTAGNTVIRQNRRVLNLANPAVQDAVTNYMLTRTSGFKTVMLAGLDNYEATIDGQQTDTRTTVTAGAKTVENIEAGRTFLKALKAKLEAQGKKVIVSDLTYPVTLNKGKSAFDTLTPQEVKDVSIRVLKNEDPQELAYLKQVMGSAEIVGRNVRVTFDGRAAIDIDTAKKIKGEAYDAISAGAAAKSSEGMTPNAVQIYLATDSDLTKKENAGQNRAIAAEVNKLDLSKARVAGIVHEGNLGTVSPAADVSVG